MINFIKDSIKEFAKSIGANFGVCDNEVKEGFISYIEVEGDLNYKIYFKFPKSALDKISERLFGEIEYELSDLLNEIANLIVGKSKVIAGDKGVSFNISLPKYLGKLDVNFDKEFKFSLDGECFSILLKEK